MLSRKQLSRGQSMDSQESRQRLKQVFNLLLFINIGIVLYAFFRLSDSRAILRGTIFLLLWSFFAFQGFIHDFFVWYDGKAKKDYLSSSIRLVITVLIFLLLFTRGVAEYGELSWLLLNSLFVALVGLVLYLLRHKAPKVYPAVFSLGLLLTIMVYMRTLTELLMGRR
jgi:hypothetical protein